MLRKRYPHGRSGRTPPPNYRGGGGYWLKLAHILLDKTTLRLFSDYSRNSENQPARLVGGWGCTHTGVWGAVAGGSGFFRVSKTL